MNRNTIHILAAPLLMPLAVTAAAGRARTKQLFDFDGQFQRVTLAVVAWAVQLFRKKAVANDGQVSAIDTGTGKLNESKEQR